MTDQQYETQGRLIKAAHDFAAATNLDGSRDGVELAWLIHFDAVSTALGVFSAARRQEGPQTRP